MSTFDPTAPLKPWTPDEARAVVQAQIAANLALDADRDVRRFRSRVAAKLTANEVQQIRSIYSGGGITTRELATQYDVNHSTIYKIVARTTWKDVA